MIGTQIQEISTRVAILIFFICLLQVPQLYGSTLLNCWSAPINVQKIFSILGSTGTQALQQRLSVEQEILHFSDIL